jgi:hypothetical protein
MVQARQQEILDDLAFFAGDTLVAGLTMNRIQLAGEIYSRHSFIQAGTRPNAKRSP